MLRIILLSVVSAVVFAIILTGCGSSEQDFPTTETGFPIGFVRESDGAQIRLGMSRDDVGEILQSMDLFGEPIESSGPTVLYEGIAIDYSGDTVARIVALSEEWAISGGFSRGDNIQSVFDSNEFRYLFHIDESRMVVIIDTPPENASFRIDFIYDEDGTIGFITLGDVMFWEYLD